MTVLSHLTCSHGHDGIQREGLIRPFPQPMLGGVSLSWWTDDAGLPAPALGLQSTVTACDRTEFHYLADVPHAVPWTEFRHQLLPEFSESVSMLEFGRSPKHWFVTNTPVEWAEYGWRDQS